VHTRRWHHNEPMVGRSAGSCPGSCSCRSTKGLPRECSRTTRGEVAGDNRGKSPCWTCLEHASEQTPVGRSQNSATPTDLGDWDCIQRGVGDRPRMGDQEPRHLISLGSVEHNVPKQPQQAHLQVSGDSRVVSVSSHVVDLHKMRIFRYVCCTATTKQR
jgi:hypothetical protein